jgi:hypothetical protein
MEYTVPKLSSACSATTVETSLLCLLSFPTYPVELSSREIQHTAEEHLTS